jgi:hypothetical protein
MSLNKKFNYDVFLNGIVEKNITESIILVEKKTFIVIRQIPP